MGRTYFKVRCVDGIGGAAAFEDEDEADALCEAWNNEYDSEYEVFEDDMATTAEVMHGKALLALEGLA